MTLRSVQFDIQRSLFYLTRLRQQSQYTHGRGTMSIYSGRKVFAIVLQAGISNVMQFLLLYPSSMCAEVSVEFKKRLKHISKDLKLFFHMKADGAPVSYVQ